jgi:hypothetical protein
VEHTEDDLEDVDDPAQIDAANDDENSRLRELTVRGGGYVLLFLTFAPLAAVTILQIPTDVPGTKYMIHPSVSILAALKAWMVAVIPIFGSILPTAEILQRIFSVPTAMKIAKYIKITLIWVGVVICVYGIVRFLGGL